MLNANYLRHPTVFLNAGNKEQTFDLDPGVPTSEIRLRVAGSFTVAGATPAAAVLLDDQIARLIPRITLDYDGEPIVRDIPMRDMHQIWLRTLHQEPTQDFVSAAESIVAGTYPFEFNTGIPFAAGWLRRPWDTHLPRISAKKLTLRVEFSHDKEQAGDGIGTGSFIKTAGTTAVYTFGVTPSVECVQVTHPRENPNSKPAAIRHYSQFVTKSWAAAQAQLVEYMQSEREFDFHLIRCTYGADNELADLITDVSLLSTQDKFRDKYTLRFLRAEETAMFPAVRDETGYVGILWAHDGSLMNAVRPQDHKNLRYEFTTTAPASGDAKITITSGELVR